MAITWTGDDDWYSPDQPLSFPVLGQPVRVMAYVGRHTSSPGVLTPAHTAAVEALLALPAGRRGGWTAQVHADFKRAFKTGTAETSTAGVRKRCPEPEDVWSLVRWDEVVVPDQGPNGDRYILVHGRPGWRVEHGLQLLLKNEQLLWVGRADEALFMDSDWSRDYRPHRRR
jgi:hypothetical protein